MLRSCWSSNPIMICPGRHSKGYYHSHYTTQLYNSLSSSLLSFQTSRRSRWGLDGLSLPSLRLRSGSQDRHKMEEAGERKSRSLGGKISFWKRKSAQITDYDPTYRVIYLGNVLTGWAKGNPLKFIWRPSVWTKSFKYRQEMLLLALS